MVYHIQDVMVPISYPLKLEEIMNDIPGNIISVIKTSPDNWRIIWASEE